MASQRRCENCTNWMNSDGVWGVCFYASNDNDTPERRAAATSVRLGREHPADLETKYDFGCVAWKSLNSKTEGAA